MSLGGIMTKSATQRKPKAKKSDKESLTSQIKNWGINLKY